MQFNDTVTELGICQEIDDICDSTIASYSLAKKARRCNTAVEDLEMQILMADGTWLFDDKNYGSLPTGLMTLVDNQQAYAFDSTLLVLHRIEIQDINGIWHTIDPIDDLNLGDYIAVPEYLKLKGLPIQYAKRGESILLYPPPSAASVTLVNGMRVYFKRQASLFTAADTTKMPGIASPFHILVAQKAALPYCKTYKKDRVPQLVLDISEGEKKMLRYYSNRGKDTRGQMTMKKIRAR